MLWALWAHFEAFRDVEFVSTLYRNLLVAAVVAGLEGAAHLVHAFGDRELAVRYRKEAGIIRDAARDYLYDKERGHFSRIIVVRPD